MSGNCGPFFQPTNELEEPHAEPTGMGLVSLPRDHLFFARGRKIH